MYELDHPKLVKLAELEGFSDTLALVEHSTFDSVIPAICMKDDCDAVAEMEPDQNRGYCEICGDNTVQSALIVAGMI